jgi:hypothetical protein
MTDTPPPTSPVSKEPIPLFLSDEPSMIADYIQRHKAVDENAPAYSFCDFVKEMRTTDFEDDFQMRAILESQAHLLGTAFQYLMLEGNWKYLSSALRTQRIMRDTIEAMNKFPRLSYMRDYQPDPQDEPEKNATNLDR